MTVPTGISCKLRRAHEHLEALDRSVEGFLDPHEKPTRILADDDAETGERFYRFELLREPPVTEWAILTGEIIYQLRTALDHLAWQLCIAHAPSDPPPRGTEFPIFWDPDRFDDLKPGGGLHKIRGMSGDMQDAIRALQPYNRGNPAKSQSLWVLQDMNNEDKHRSLNLSVVGNPGIAFFVQPDVEIIPVIHSEDRLALAIARPATPETEIHGDPSFTFQVVLDERSPGARRPLVSQCRTFERIVTEMVADLSQRFFAL